MSKVFFTSHLKCERQNYVKWYLGIRNVVLILVT